MMKEQSLVNGILTLLLLQSLQSARYCENEHPGMKSEAQYDALVVSYLYIDQERVPSI